MEYLFILKRAQCSGSLWLKRKIFVEKELYDKAQKCLDIMDLILKVDLIKTALNLGPYSKLVREFIVNLFPAFDDANPHTLGVFM